MTRTTLAVILLLGTGCPDGVDVFVIAGQSNAVGASGQDRYLPTRHGLAWTTWDAIVAAVDPLHRPFGHSSPWPTFTDAWEATTGRSAFLVTTAEIGSCLVGDHSWIDRREPRWDPETGDLYARMVSQAREVGRVRAVLWMQGECEVHELPDRAAYLDGLTRLAAAIEEDLGAPLVVAPVSLRPVPWPDEWQRHEIHDAALDAIAAGIVGAGPSLDDIMHESDGVHLHDVMEVGRRWATALVAAGM